MRGITVDADLDVVLTYGALHDDASKQISLALFRHASLAGKKDREGLRMAQS